jgi:hypothetical protein
MDYKGILKKGFAWIHDRKVWSYVVALMVTGLVSLTVIVYLIQLFIEQLSFGSSDFLVLFFQLIAFVFLFSLVFGLIQGFFYALIVLKGMQFYKIKTAPFNAVKYIKLVLLYVASFVLALISYYERKGLYFFIAVIALYSISIISFAARETETGIILLFVALLASLAYAFVVIYNSIKLFVAPFVFLEKKQGVFASLRESWKITKGKVLAVFIAIVIVSLVVIAVSGIGDYIGKSLFSAFFPHLIPEGSTPQLMYAAQTIGTLILIKGIPAVIISAIMQAFVAYSYTGIYFEVKKK